MKTIRKKLTYTVMVVHTNNEVKQIIYPGDWSALTNAKRGKWMDENHFDSVEPVEVITKKHEMPVDMFITLSTEIN